MTENSRLSADLEAKTLELDETKARYMQLLKTTSQTSAAVHGSPSPSNALGPDGVSPRRSLDAQKSIKVKRSIDVQLVGATNVGKTSLLADFVTKESPEMLERLNEQRSTLLAHHQLTLDGAPLKILDCSGNPRASHLVKGWFASAQWVICVYDVCEPETLTVALDLMETALTALRHPNALSHLHLGRLHPTAKPVDQRCGKPGPRTHTQTKELG